MNSDRNKTRRRRPTISAAGSPIEALESRTLLSSIVPTYPTATLTAANLKVAGPTYTFTVTYLSNKRIRTSQLDNHDISITGPNGYSRAAYFVGFVDNVKQVIARYKVSTPSYVWSAADNGTYVVNMNGRQLSDGGNNYAAAGRIGAFTIALSAYPSDIGKRPAAPNGALDATRYGAIPNDGKDDTAAIQKVINALPRANGVTDASAAIGGTVWLPAGTYNVSTLTLSSGVTLRGAGASTILLNSSTDGTSAVVRFASYFTHLFVGRITIEDMTFQTLAAKGIQSTTDTSDMNGLTLERLTFNTGGTSIDFRQNDVYQTTLQDITINNPGTTAIWITIKKSPGNSAINRLQNVVVQGAMRSGFIADTALVVLGGDMAVDGLSIGDTGAPVVPLLVRHGTITFTNTTLPNNGFNGVVAALDQDRVDFDQLSNLSSSRRLQLSDMRDVHVGKLSLIGSTTLAQALVSDSDSHITVDQLYANGQMGNVGPLQVSVSQQLSGISFAAHTPTIQTTEAGAVSTIVVNAGAFGAIGNDNLDDTAAIQAAINSLPRGNGLPTSSPGSNIVGGMVFLSNGTFNTSSALRIPSGVWLVGQGAGTLLYSTAPAGSQAIQLVSGAYAGYNIGAGVSDMALYTTSAAGVRSDSALTGGLFDLQISGTIISAGGTGIDLRPARAFHTNIDDIQITSPGGDAIWIGDDAGYSADNHVRGLQLTGQARSNFSGDRALFVFTGQNTLEDIWIEQSSAFILPLYVSGAADIRGMWLEYPSADCPNGITAEFENASNITIDRLLSVDLGRRLQLRNANVNIGYLNIANTTNQLTDCLDLDGTSKLSIGTVNAIYDAGMLDNPQVTIGGVFNQTDGSYVSTAFAQNSTNNIADSAANWQVQWGDSLGAVQGIVGRDPSSLQVSISSNPNNRPTAITVHLNVQAAMVGHQSIARWRIDGPQVAVVYTTQYGVQFSTRTLNSETAALSPTVLQVGDILIIQLPPISSGQFVISDVAVFPI